MTIGILSIGLLLALAAYLMWVKPWRDEPRKAKKQEKSEIIRQLLALSEQESSISPGAARKLHASGRPFVGPSRKS